VAVPAADLVLDYGSQQASGGAVEVSVGVHRDVVLAGGHGQA
jgi:hypothetical protein